MNAAALLSSLTFLVACGTSGSPEALVSIDTMPGGIPRITTSSPIEAGQWALVHERDVQPDIGMEGELLSPQDIALADDGTLYVVEEKPASVKVFDANGNFLKTIGRDGSGPGEFRVGFVVSKDHLLALQDPQESRTTVFDTQGDSVLLIQRTTCCYWDKIFVDGQNRVVLPAMTTPDSTDGPRQDFVRFPIRSGGLDTAMVSRDPAQADSPAWVINGPGGGMMMRMVVPLAPRAFETVDPTGSFITGWSDEYTLRKSSDGRDTTMLFGRPLERTPVTTTEKAMLVEAKVQQVLGNGMNLDEASVRQSIDRELIPSRRPAFSRLYADGTGRTWVRLSNPDTVNVHLDIFDSEGRWLDNITINHPLWATADYTPLSFSGNGMAIIAEDSTGLPVINIYRIQHSTQ